MAAVFVLASMSLNVLENMCLLLLLVLLILSNWWEYNLLIFTCCMFTIYLSSHIFFGDYKNTVLSLFVHHRGAYIVLLTYDNLYKPKPVEQVVVAAIMILSNVCHTWTMCLCMDSVKFLLEAPGASILWGRYYFVTGRALPIGTLRYSTLWWWWYMCFRSMGKWCVLNAAFDSLKWLGVGVLF